MTIDRVSTSGFYQRTLSNITSVQSNLQTLTGQISSGKQFSEFSELSRNGNLEKVFSFRSQIESAQSFIRSGELISNRLEAMNNRIETIESITSDFLSREFPLYNDVTAPNIDLRRLSENLLGDLRGQLNASLEGRFLFSGGRTDQEPVANIELLSNLQNNNSEVSANYYLGDANQLTINISETSTVQYGVTADESAFQKIIGAAHMAIVGSDRGSQQVINDAQDLMREGYSELLALQTQVKNNADSISLNISIHTSVIEELQVFSSEIEDTDIVEATAQLAANETVLQASYSAFARVSELSLSDFLR